MLGSFFIRKGSLDRVLNYEQTFKKGSSNSVQQRETMDMNDVSLK